jgi:hypothetical protein
MYMSVKDIVGKLSCIYLLRVLLVSGHVCLLRGLFHEWSCICLLRVLLGSGHVYVC